MMSFTKTLTNLDSFIKIKKACPFCHTTLVPILTNFEEVSWATEPQPVTTFNQSITRMSDKYVYVSNVNTTLTHGSFAFDLKIGSDLSKVLITTHGNIARAQGSIEINPLLTALDMLKLHVELQCLYSSCDVEYYVSSMPLDFYLTQDLKLDDDFYSGIVQHEDTIRFRDVKLWMEAFSYNHLWVQNDWDEKVMRIFARNKPNSIPLKYDILDLESMPKQKIINRIQTMVNFS